MSDPRFFYVMHFQVKHQIILQSVAKTALAIFTRYHPDATVDITSQNNNYATVFVETDQPVSSHASDLFEDWVIENENINAICSHSTYNEDEDLGSYKKTYLYTICATNNFGHLSIFFNGIYRQLISHLNLIPEGYYYLEFIPGSIVIFLESEKPFSLSDISKILEILNHRDIQIQAQYRNF